MLKRPIRALVLMAALGVFTLLVAPDVRATPAVASGPYDAAGLGSYLGSELPEVYGGLFFDGPTLVVLGTSDAALSSLRQAKQRFDERQPPAVVEARFVVANHSLRLLEGQRVLVASNQDQLAAEGITLYAYGIAQERNLLRLEVSDSSDEAKQRVQVALGLDADSFFLEAGSLTPPLPLPGPVQNEGAISAEPAAPIAADAAFTG